MAAPHGFVVGSQSRHGRSALIGTAEGVQVDLPWSVAAAVFGPEVKDLADRAVGFPELSGGAELTDRLPETAVTDRQRLVAGWLRARTESHELRRQWPYAPCSGSRRAHRPSPPSPRSSGAAGVTSTASYGAGRASRPRPWCESTGCTASSRSPGRSEHRSLADAATLLGYADHPHLCHETRQLAGRTPTQLLGQDIDAPDANRVT